MLSTKLWHGEASGVSHGGLANEGGDSHRSWPVQNRELEGRTGRVDILCPLQQQKAGQRWAWGTGAMEDLHLIRRRGKMGARAQDLPQPCYLPMPPTIKPTGAVEHLALLLLFEICLPRICCGAACWRRIESNRWISSTWAKTAIRCGLGGAEENLGSILWQRTRT